jgi:orotidine-5'-phosphate decarboxylase
MGERAGFGERLVAAVVASSPLCVGLDPSASLLERWGLPDTAAGVESMAVSVIDAIAGTAAAVKPQVAYFERHGTRGYAALEVVIAAARDRGLLVVADAKRGDIDATMTAYGEAWLADGSPLCVDALTVSAYLGLGAMEQVVEMATIAGRGLFAVVASSNPEGRSLQEAISSTGRRVEEDLLADLALQNARETATTGRVLGSLGAVVGATRTAGSLPLAGLAGPYLVPGVGAQGATARDVGALFSGCPRGSVLVNASRSILAAGPGPEDVAVAARELADELNEALS